MIGKTRQSDGRPGDQTADQAIRGQTRQSNGRSGDQTAGQAIRGQGARKERLPVEPAMTERAGNGNDGKGPQ